jgi:proteasome lid subunit RPN8/RPN11
VQVAASAYWQIATTVGARPAEHGGLLLGPADSDEITEFWFDPGPQRGRTTYSPDTATMNRLLRERWRPRGLDWKGMVHSHPRGFEELTPGDLAYIARLLATNADLKRFVAPIALPDTYVLRTFVIIHERPTTPLVAQLKII